MRHVLQRVEAVWNRPVSPGETGRGDLLCGAVWRCVRVLDGRKQDAGLSRSGANRNDVRKASRSSHSSYLWNHRQFKLAASLMTIIGYFLQNLLAIAIATALIACVTPSYAQPATPVGTQNAPSSSPAPAYPRRELLAGIGGTVVLLITVDRVGRPVGVRVDSTSGNRHLDRAAIKAAKKWRFHPGFMFAGGVRVPITFDPNAETKH